MPTRPLLLTCLLALASAACASSEPEDVSAAEADLTTQKLEVIAQSRLPLPEVSGLGTRTVDGHASHLAIGDSSWILATFETTKAGKPRAVKKHDLSTLFGDGASQWEAVAGDSSGHVFILDEGNAKIHVLDPELSRVEHRIKLTMPSDHPLAHSWEQDDNSRGEGMLLLANGHVLLAKEKGPAALIEFAPQQANAEGYRPELALGDRPFPIPEGDSSELVPVAFWELKTTAARLVGDISDLATDAEGRLLLLSDQSRAIVRVERELLPEEGKIDLKAVYELPRTVDKPEGLIVVAGKPLVAVDQPESNAEVLFQLDALL